jgi:hypothetical protein
MRNCTTVVVLVLVICLSSIILAQAPAPPASTDSATLAQQPAEKTSSAVAPWDKFTTFTALMTGGPVIGTAEEIHIYRHGNLLRMEGQEHHSYVIQDLTKSGDARMISKADCLRMKIPFVRSYPFSFSWSPNRYETVVVGKETIDGHPTQVEEVTIIFAPVVHHDPVTIKIWAAEDLQGFPVKIENKLHHTIEYRNVNFEAQDPTLFIIPGACEPLDAEKENTPLPQPKKAPQKAPSKGPQ